MLEMIIIQLIGAIGYGTLAVSYYKKDKKQILFIQIISYIFFTIHYYLLAGITGAICNVIGLIALIIIYCFDKYKLKNKKIVSMFLVLLLLIINIMNFQNIFSIFPMIASIIVILSFLEENENVIRGVGVLSAICWLVYAIAYKSYISIAFEVVTLGGVLGAFLKTKNQKNNDIKKDG